MGKKIYKLTIEPLTCVHIGTGKQLTLLDYTVKETKSGIDKYMHFSADSILNRIAGEPGKIQEFDIASSSGNMKDLQTFFQENFSIEDDSIYSCEITREFAEKYLQNIKRDPYENAALVNQTYRPIGESAPVIPGSSLKGAIRTAILNDLLSKIDADTNKEFVKSLDNEKFHFQGNPYKLSNALNKLDKRIQSTLLSESDNNKKDSFNAKNDPFRAVEFSDCSFPLDTNQITGVLKTISKSYSNDKDFISNPIQIQVEAIMGSLMDTRNIGHGILRINSDLSRSRNGVTRLFTISDIVRSCNYFFWREFENEYNKFYKDASQYCDLIEKLKDKLQEIRTCNNQFIVRVGRWSQAEFVTYEENLRSPSSGKYGFTRTVFNYDGQYLPMGWCKCGLEEI